MRSRLAQITFPTLCLAVLCLCTKPATSVEASGRPCPVPKGHIVGGLKISQVSFAGPSKLPLSVQEQIAHSIERQVFGPSMEAVTDQAVEQATVAWHNRGYFKAVTSSAGATLNAFPPQTISLTIQVEAGSRYRLGQITFKNNKALTNTKALRSLFAISDGDVFASDKIGKGLENLRNAYTEFGYINFTSIPEMTFDEGKKRVSLDMDVDEGKQFSVRSIDILGLDETSRAELLRDAPLRAGQIYNSRLLKLLIERHPNVFRFAAHDPAHFLRRLDERASTVAITIDARPCAQP